MLAGMFLGLRTVIYPAPDLDAAKAWFTEVLGREPYFDQSFYVGFEVGGYELGLSPAAAVREPGGSVLGIIENPHFAIADPPPEVGSGPGR